MELKNVYEIVVLLNTNQSINLKINPENNEVTFYDCDKDEDVINLEYSQFCELVDKFKEIKEFINKNLE